MTDELLIRSLRLCLVCGSTGHSDKTPMPCPHCRLDRIAADRIEKLLVERQQANEPIVERVRENCARAIKTFDEVANEIRALTVEELMREPEDARTA